MKRWSELSANQRRLIIALAGLQLSLLAAALWDLARRPAEAIRGKKWMWALVSLISFVGPLAYFRFGRRPASEPATERA